MGSRDKDTKSLQDKLKQYFKKGASAPLPPRNELVVTAELERALGREALLARRLRLLKETGDKILTTRVHTGGVERLWACTRDLLEESSVETRHAELHFLSNLAEGQADQLLVMRSVLFRYLRDSLPTHPAEDAPPRFRLLQTLTNGGKDITCLEDQIGPFLLEWMPLIQSSSFMVDFLQLITNVVKFNATYLNEEIVHAIVNWACHICSWAGEGAAVEGALALLEAVVCYSLLPRGALAHFVRALARAVNVEHYCRTSWKVMRYVIGADLGYAALQEMVDILTAAGHSEPGEVDAGLVRGAVFYINMALWGARRVPNLKISYLAVLPSFLQALNCAQQVVTYEVLLAMQSLVGRAAAELHEPAWDIVLEIVARLLQLDQELEPPNELIHSQLHQLLTSLEQLVSAGAYCGDLPALWALLDTVGHQRPEASTLRLVSALAAELSPERAGWAAGAAALIERYVRAEPRPAVRAHALHALHLLVRTHRHLHEEELLEGAAGPAAAAASADPEPSVRAAAARLAADLALCCSSEPVADLIDAMEKILNRPLEQLSRGGGGGGVGSGVAGGACSEAETAAVRAALTGLTDVFTRRVLRAPPGPPARALLVLLEHVERVYRLPPQAIPYHPDIRLKILELLCSIRVSARGAVGLAGESGAPRYSPYLLAEPDPHAHGTCALPLGRVTLVLTTALQREVRWSVLAGVLRGAARLPPAPPARRPDLDVRAATLAAMLSDKSLNYPECLLLPPGQKLSQSEFHGAVLPALAALAPCHPQLEPATQQRTVRCLLKYGIVLRQPASQQCMSALTILTLEARDTMVKMLPEVLLDLSKISDTKAIACPMLEFLSTLTRLPSVFASFVEDQYMSVFAILLPYTNPSRYNHYVVSLAHHVVAAWFLKCRLAYRRNFVPFIIHGLHNYIILPFEEQLFRSSQQHNEDSSNRKRSSSLGSKNVSRAPLGGAGGAAGGGGGGAHNPVSAAAAFHLELTETCVDLLARYAFSVCSVKPTRSSTAEALLSGGQTTTWLVGHKLVSITTARQLCERCAAAGPGDAPHDAPPPAPPAAPPAAPPPAPPDAPPATAATGGSPPRATPPRSPDLMRQNSTENSNGSDPLADAIAAFTEKFEMMTKEAEEPEAAAGGGAAAGAATPCACDGATWCELHVRSPAGDTAWLLRLQNQMSFTHLLQARGDPLGPRSEPAHRQGSSEGVSRSGSTSSQPSEPSSEAAVSGAALSAAAPPARGVVQTSPINIPGSPQRQSSSSTTDDDDVVQDGKSRHPVRRSNSSPEMSSSWKMTFQRDEPAETHTDMILLPSVEATSASMSLHACKKAAKKSDMRVSCEAIPEEMCGSSPVPPSAVPLAAGATGPAAAAAGVGPTAGAAPATGDAADHGALQKTASEGAVSDLPPLARSKRSNTISVMSPARRRDNVSPRGSRGGGGGGGGGGAGGVSPAFVLLQLYHNMPAALHVPHGGGAANGGGAAGGGGGGSCLCGACGGGGAAWERPLRVYGPQHERTIKSLDLVPPLETYKVGVLYVGPGQQDNEVAILKNEYGSLRYSQFLSALGTLVELDGSTQPQLFLHLEQGAYTYVWHDDIMQVHFHVATAMPTLARDPSCNEKRKYIGNDHVSIVYNDSGQEFNIHTIKGQLNFCIVVVEPLEHGISRVLVKTKDERIRSRFLAHLMPQLVSEPNVPLLARQLALHASLASHISQSLSMAAALPYASNSLERLRIIKRLRARLEAEREAAAAAAAPYAPRRRHMGDFTEYT